MKNIALVAHDGRKQEMLEWVKYNIKTLEKHNLYATGTTGKLIEKIGETSVGTGKFLGTDEGYEELMKDVPGPLNGKVNILLSGPLGGDQQIGAMIAEGKIDCLIFFCDNLITQGHQQDVSALTRLASLYNIAFATNRTTADMILTSPLLESDDYEKIVPSVINGYKNRTLK